VDTNAIASDRPALVLAKAQGAFYLVSGIWPVLHMRSFEAVTGPKTDHWLVKTVGLLITVVGGTLVISARRGRLPREMAVLGGGSAGVLGAVSLYYALRGRISKIYLLDAGVELSLATAWAAVGKGTR
jgi:hypothetical protein